MKRGTSLSDLSKAIGLKKPVTESKSEQKGEKEKVNEMRRERQQVSFFKSKSQVNVSKNITNSNITNTNNVKQSMEGDLPKEKKDQQQVRNKEQSKINVMNKKSNKTGTPQEKIEEKKEKKVKKENYFSFKK